MSVKGMALLAIGWLLLVLTGFAGLSRYEAKPGEEKLIPTDWPADSHVAFVPGSYNLVMAVHPRCPCTRASLEELAHLLAKSPHDNQLCLLVWRGTSMPIGWEDSGVKEIKARFPNANVIIDVDGSEAERFGVVGYPFFGPPEMGVP